MMRFFLLLSISALSLTLPIKEDTLDNSDPPEFTTNTSETRTSPASDVFISSLLPPSSISDCLTSGYCNQGNCLQGAFIIALIVTKIVKKDNIVDIIQLKYPPTPRW